MKISSLSLGWALVNTCCFGLFLLSSTAWAKEKKNKVDPSAAPVAQSIPVTLQIFNYTGRPVEMLWLNPAGGLQSYGNVPPTAQRGSPVAISTFSGHQWVFRSGGKVIETYTASAKTVQTTQIGEAGDAQGTPNPPNPVIPQPTPKIRNPMVPVQPIAGQTVTISVTNYTTATVAVFQIKPDGTKKKWGTIAPLSPDQPPVTIAANAGQNWTFEALGQTAPLTTTAQKVQNVTFGTPPSHNPGNTGNNDGPVTSATPKPLPVTANTGGVPQSAQEFMKVHNDERAKVGVPPLKWSSQLASIAQDWANQLAASGQFKHRPPTAAQLGENIFGGSPGFTPGDAARSWLSEKSAYHGGPLTPQNSAAIGHYTQMVWRSTTEVGYGIATGPGGVIVVANYRAGGNFVGQNPY